MILQLLEEYAQRTALQTYVLKQKEYKCIVPKMFRTKITRVVNLKRCCKGLNICIKDAKTALEQNQSSILEYSKEPKGKGYFFNVKIKRLEGFTTEKDWLVKN